MALRSPSIVLIHGYGFDSRIWLPVELAFNGYNVISLALPGFGNDTFNRAYTIDELARLYWDELSIQNVEVIHLVGHSMGGYVCMEMIAQQPHRVSSLCLLHSHVFADPEDKKKARTGVLEEIRSGGHEPFIRRMISSMVFDKISYAPIIDQLIARGLTYTVEAWYNGTQAIRDRKDHAETLINFKGPILMVMGEADTAVPISLAYKQAVLVDQAKLIAYPNVGHLSMYENTAALISDLTGFLAGL